jgi:hypothetical protein
MNRHHFSRHHFSHHFSLDEARIRSDDLDNYPLKDPATVKPGEFYSISNKVYLDDQVYDIVLFRAAVREFIDRETKTPGKYVIGARDCYSFQEAAIEYGKQKSRRRRDPTMLPASLTKPSALLLSPPVAGAAKRTKSTARSLIVPALDVLDLLDDYFGRY